MPRKASGRPQTAIASRKTARLELRVTTAQKREYQRAAELQGLDLTEFVTVSLTSAARTTIAQAEVITLAERDRKVFFAALANPPAPAPALLKAADRYKQLFGI